MCQGEWYSSGELGKFKAEDQLIIEALVKEQFHDLVEFRSSWDDETKIGTVLRVAA